MILISEPLFFSTLLYLVPKYNLSNMGYSWASQLTCCISATNPVICGIFTTTHLITKHIYLFIQYVFIYMYSLCMYWYVCLHYVSIDIYVFIQYVFICIYRLCMYSYISINIHTHALSLLTFATSVVFLQHLRICCVCATFVELMQHLWYIYNK